MVSRRNILFVAALVGSVTILPQICAYGGWEVLYQNDFSANPGWSTDQPSNFYWESALGTYFLRGTNSPPAYTPNRYSVVDVSSYDESRPFRLEWDLQMLRSDWSAGINFGLYDSQLKYLTSTTGSAAITTEYAHADFTLRTLTHQDPAQAYGDSWTSYGLSTWYHNLLEYDPGTDIAKWTVTPRGATTPLATATATNVPTITSDLSYLGSSRYPLGAAGTNPSAKAEARIDNVVFSQASSEAEIFGLFLGVRDDGDGTKGTLRADIGANILFNTLAQNVPGFREEDSIVLTGHLDHGNALVPITEESVQQALTELRGKMTPNDTLLVYAAAHGSTAYYGYPEISASTTVTEADELMSFGVPGVTFNDDWLTASLADFDSIDKWILLDSCYSGGFWDPTGGGTDEGDLEELLRIGVLASAPETGKGWAAKDSYGVFTQGLVDAFSPDLFRSIASDTNRDRVVTFDELTDYMRLFALSWPGLGSYVYPLDEQDYPIPFTLDMWNPVAFTSPDFHGSIGYGQPIPAPGAIMLGTIGAGLVAWLRRRRAL